MPHQSLNSSLLHWLLAWSEVIEKGNDLIKDRIPHGTLNSTAWVAYGAHDLGQFSEYLHPETSAWTGHKLSSIADCSDCPIISLNCECCRCIGQALFIICRAKSGHCP